MIFNLLKLVSAPLVFMLSNSTTDEHNYKESAVINLILFNINYDSTTCQYDKNL